LSPNGDFTLFASFEGEGKLSFSCLGEGEVYWSLNGAGFLLLDGDFTLLSIFDGDGKLGVLDGMLLLSIVGDESLPLIGDSSDGDGKLLCPVTGDGSLLLVVGMDMFFFLIGFLAFRSSMNDDGLLLLSYSGLGKMLLSLIEDGFLPLNGDFEPFCAIVGNIELRPPGILLYVCDAVDGISSLTSIRDGLLVGVDGAGKVPLFPGVGNVVDGVK
jgi:hypothetical protein